MTAPFSSSSSSDSAPSVFRKPVVQQSNGNSSAGVSETVSGPASPLKSADSERGTSSNDSDWSLRPIKDKPRFNVDARITDARRQLPIYVARDAIAEAVRDNDTVVLLGETGSGKTTQIPQYLFEAGLADDKGESTMTASWGKRKTRQQRMIGITQPRRVAAISLAKRVAVEMGVPQPGADSAADEGQIESAEVSANSERNAAGPSTSNGSQKRLVGYAVRFDDQTTRDTRIKYMTDGYLLRELLSGDGRQKKGKGKRKDLNDEDITSGLSNQAKPFTHSLLDEYSVIIIDEAHERSVHTDVVLGLVKKVQKQRRRRRMLWLNKRKTGEALANDDDSDEPAELKVVVMSATIDADKFARFFATPRGTPAPILYVKGRQHSIKLYHSLDVCQDWIESCKKVIVMLNAMPPGDVLVFTTGAEEIESCASDLKDLNEAMQALAKAESKPPPMQLLVVKLYAALGGEAIRQCFAPTPPHTRKIILATNIAETSITISGIKYVIDSGLVKERTFHSSATDEQSPGHAGIGASFEMLTARPVSKAAARQRAGRAGRETDGFCYRLYTKDQFDSLEESTQPEILRTDLTSVMLDVFALGLDPLSFEWLDRPDHNDMMVAILSLVELGALAASPSKPGEAYDGSLHLTKLGRQMSKLPLAPALSKTLLTARDYTGGDEEAMQVFTQALDLVSILSTERRTILIEPSGRGGVGEDGNDAASKRRQEADRARERLAHRNGDHATQLQALYAFEEAEENSKYLDFKNGQKKKILDTKRLREWCDTNYVSIKAVREAIRIRDQILRVCMGHYWLPEFKSAAMIIHRLDFGEHNDRSPIDSSDEEDEELVVTRKKGNPATAKRTAAPSQTTSTYSALRRCLMQGKRVNVGLREGESGNYRRYFGGGDTFRIHPASSLMLTAASSEGAMPTSRLPQVIYFEDIVYTTQSFARTVSAVEPAWLSELKSSNSS